jgi:hypothetical protein
MFDSETSLLHIHLDKSLWLSVVNPGYVLRKKEKCYLTNATGKYDIAMLLLPNWLDLMLLLYT